MLVLNDVHQHLHSSEEADIDRLRIKKFVQYKGYSCDMSGCKNADDYLAENSSKKSQNNLRKHIRKLESCFDVDFRVYGEDISPKDYESIIGSFFSLLEKRWVDLSKDNDILKDKIFYKELIYEMLKSKEAKLFILSADNSPVNIALGFTTKQYLFFAITAFDSDYGKFNVGHIMIKKMVDWCLQNDIITLDFSKGTYEYKLRWANNTYNFENHVIYDSGALKSLLLGTCLNYFYELKEYLRRKKVNVVYSKLKQFFKLSAKKNLQKIEVSLKDLNGSHIDVNSLPALSRASEAFDLLRPTIYNLVFYKPQKFTDVQVYVANEENTFIISGENILQRALISTIA
ncbi:GNAT family N-acetyltransferase [Maribacter halichondriae]|uniref:GNAT family N-acetyltransferase n=1 Tax=Maribacter halichondriae TaxID=2980554 RepID=UPI0023582AA0|nr:GNAT family N-acetyltransferase [Maribacter sp. Hal144]